MSFGLEFVLVLGLFDNCLGFLLLLFCNQLHHSPVRSCLTLPRHLQHSTQAVGGQEKCLCSRTGACDEQLLYEQYDMLKTN